MAEDERSKFAMQVAGRAESGYPKILATDDDGNLKVKLSFNPSPGTDHTASGVKFTDTAGESLVFGNLCYMKSDGKWWKADADAIATMPGLALALATIAADAVGVFLKMGFARDDTWNWTAGGALYASTVAGGLTQTAPSGSGDIVQTVGFALTADISYFKPNLALLDAAPVDGSIARGIPSNWAYDHAADLDAHHLSHFEKAYIGTGYNPYPVVYDYAAGVAITADTLYGILIFVPRTMTFSDIWVNIGVQAGQKLRFGAYKAGSNLVPDALEEDLGEHTLSGIGIKGLSAIDLQLTRGFWYLCVVSDGTPSLVQCTIEASPLGLNIGNLYQTYSGFTASHTYGALPATFPSATIAFRVPMVQLETKSLD